MKEFAVVAVAVFGTLLVLAVFSQTEMCGVAQSALNAV